MKVEWIADREGFGDLAEEWDALLPADSHPFDLHCWYEAWWEAFGGDRELAVCVARRDGELAAAFPLCVDGRSLMPLANEHSALFRPLATDSEALDATIDAVCGRLGTGAVLRYLPAEDPTLERIVSRSPGPCLIESTFGSPIVTLKGDYRTWREENKHRWKSPLEQKRRRMERDHEAELAIAEPPADVEAELAAGLALEASGWKGREGTAIESRPETARFYGDLARRFAERGELRFTRIVLDEDLVAFCYSIQYGGRLYTLKSAYDERYRRLAPGLVMQIETVKRGFELGLDAIELLGEEADWKLRFADTARPHAMLRIYPRRARGVSAYLYRRDVRPHLKRVYNRVRLTR